MATLKRTIQFKKKSPKGGSICRLRTQRKGVQQLTVTLPTKRSELSNSILDYSILVHGEKKIGKTTLFAQEEGSFFLEWDPQQKAKKIFQRHVPDWNHFLAYLSLLEADHPFQTIVVDGTDLMYNACFRHVCAELGIGHPSDVEDFGKSWNRIKSEFSDAIHRLLNLRGCSCRFLCHSNWKEIKTRTGGKVDKLVPVLTGQAEEVLVGLVDIWAAYTYDGSSRVLVVQGNERIGAGHRVDHCFRTPDGTPIREIGMGSSAEEAYRNLVDAFANKQTYVRIEDKPSKKRLVFRKGGAIK